MVRKVPEYLQKSTFTSCYAMSATSFDTRDRGVHGAVACLG